MQPKKFSEYTPITETDGSEVIPILKDGVNATVKSEDLPISTATQTAIDAADADIAAHIADVANPHEVTKAQVGLGNADNTSDANKPVSTAQATAIALKADQSTTYTKTEVDTKDTAVADTAQTNLTTHTSNTSNPHATTKAQVGLANADNTSDVDKPVSAATQTALDAKATNTALDAHTNNTSNPHSVTKAQVGLGSVDNTSDIDKPVSAAQATADAAVASTAASNLATHTSNTSNPHATTKAQVGLSNVDNTSDGNKPVSTAQQTALNAKANASDTVNLTGNQTVAGVKTFSSSPIVPTATTTTQAVNKAQMDTADALKVNKAGDTMTGTLALPNSVLSASGQISSTASSVLAFAHSRGGQLRSWGVTSTGEFGIWNDTTSQIMLNVLNDRILLGGSTGIIRGTGFPEGVVTANVGSIYIDTAITNGASSWIKKSGTSSTGWQVLEGDTGQRDITANLVNGWTATKVFVRRVNNQVYLQVEGLNAAAMTNQIFVSLSAGFRGYSNAYVSRMLLHTAAGPAAAWRVNIEASGGVYIGNATTGTPVLYGLAPFATLDAWPSTLPGVSA